MNRTEKDIKKNWPEDQRPLVSITCIAYNHEKYIAEAIDGFLIQQTNFPFEIIIHDDASTDKTQDIIREYAKKYSTLIRTILQTENYWLGKGINATTTIVWPSCKGKYIAWCEGDDYWTDPLKLQKQVDFLEANEEFVMCYHKIQINYANSTEIIFHPNNENSGELSIQNLIEENNIQTASVVFRNILNKFPARMTRLSMGDWPLFLLLALQGKVYYMNQVMSVYNYHENGIWNSKHLIWKIKAKQKFYDFAIKNLKGDLKKVARKAQKKNSKFLINLLIKENKIQEVFIEIISKPFINLNIHVLKKLFNKFILISK